MLHLQATSTCEDSGKPGARGGGRGLETIAKSLKNMESELGVVAHTLRHFERQRQVDHCKFEFEASPVYIVSSRTTKATWGECLRQNSIQLECCLFGVRRINLFIDCRGGLDDMTPS